MATRTDYWNAHHHDYEAYTRDWPEATSRLLTFDEWLAVFVDTEED